jgi:hypothetical protein
MRAEYINIRKEGDTIMVYRQETSKQILSKNYEVISERL